MKKIFAILLAIALCGSLLTLTALADGAIGLAVSSVNAQPGETVEIYVSIYNNSGISGFDYTVTVADGLEIVSKTPMGMMGTGVWTVGSHILWDNAGDVAYSGQILKLEVKVPANAKVGDTYTVSANAVEACTYDGVIMPFGGGNGTITIVCNHNWELTSTTDSTCTEDGEELYTCSICGETMTEVIPAAHTFDETVWDHDEFAHWHNCKFCDATCCEADHQLVQIDAKDPQVGVAGYKKYKCSVCGYEETKTEDPLPPGLDPNEPMVGDIRPLMLLGFSAVLFTLAAVAYVFKRKFVK